MAVRKDEELETEDDEDDVEEIAAQQAARSKKAAAPATTAASSAASAPGPRTFVAAVVKEVSPAALQSPPRGYPADFPLIFSDSPLIFSFVAG